MSVGIIQEFDGFGPENYRAVSQEMNFPADWPDGLVAHAAGTVEGGMRIVDIWESRDQFDRFSEETIQPAIQATAGEAASQAPPPRITEFEVLAFESR